MPFRIEYSRKTADHLKPLSKREQVLIFEAVDIQLSSQPDRQTRNRKPMRPNEVAAWELRIGDLRVYYDIEAEEALVIVQAVGRKIGNRVSIGDRLVEL